MIRDANILDFADGFLIHACDSASAIGELPLDELKVPFSLVAKYTLRTALMEVISLGAKPLSASAGFSNDPEYSQSAIEFLMSFLEKMNVPLVISTEKNFETSQSGLSVSVVGFAKDIKVGNAPEGVSVYVAGSPKVGDEVVEEKEKILSFDDFLKLRAQKDIGEMIPVGSSGIFEEAKLLAQNSGLEIELEMDNTSIHKSAGPSTCVVFWAMKKPSLNIPIQKIGTLRKKQHANR